MIRVGKSQRGFTIVELLIVIVVIGILAAITIATYNGIETRAQTSKINSDLATLDKAIESARINTGKVLKDITGSTATAGSCMSQPAGTNLATLSRSDPCWTTYLASLQAIAGASGANLNNFVDPWGRPYVIDENEQENTAANGPCGLGKDTIAVYSRPLTGGWSYTNSRSMPYITPGC